VPAAVVLLLVLGLVPSLTLSAKRETIVSSCVMARSRRRARASSIARGLNRALALPRGADVPYGKAELIFAPNPA